MDNPYHLHTWSKHYREETLREAGARRLQVRCRRTARSLPSGKQMEGGEEVNYVALRSRLAALVAALVLALAVSGVFGVDDASAAIPICGLGQESHPNLC
jgi:hypothetical protein